MPACHRNVDDLTVFELLRATIARLGCAASFSRESVALLLALLVSSLLWFAPGTLSGDARLTMIIVALCIIGWTLTRIPDSLVAIGGALALVAAGVLPAATLYAATGSDIVWLLIAAFIIAAVLKASGLVERCIGAALRPFTTVASVFYAVALVIAATAFVVPSTSGRAALLLPVFLALADRLPDGRLVRPLALLFPTAILLSAGGSLIGAGAHFIAVDAIAAKTGQGLSFLRWIALAFPVTLLSTIAATWLILRLFVAGDVRTRRLAADSGHTMPMNRRQRATTALMLGLVATWVTTPWHGLDVAFVAIVGAALLMLPAFTGLKPKELFRSVETELIVFLAATAVVADATVSTGLDKWLADGLVALLPAAMAGSLPVAVALTAAVALLAHLAINSRTARAAVLVPAVALPMAALGHDVTTLVLVTVLGTGFCQTLMASAKPVAIYGNLDRETFGQTDLLRLALPLLPVKFVLLVAFALLVWPQQMSGGRAGLDAAPVAAITAPAPGAVIETLPVRPPDFPGAHCSRNDLRTLMIATIAERRMWRSGWWRVWKRLRDQGYQVEQRAIKAIYREDDLVKLGKTNAERAALSRVAGEAAARNCASQ